MINGIGYTTGVQVMGRATDLEYVAMAGSLISGLCIVISLVALRLMKTRRVPQADLSSK
jgi:energy-converting hydrogenase Eha subunit C